MNAKIEDVLFLFPPTCGDPDCEEESCGNGQAVSIQDIKVDGWPLCPGCDKELTPEDNCMVNKTSKE